MNNTPKTEKTQLLGSVSKKRTLRRIIFFASILFPGICLILSILTILLIPQQTMPAGSLMLIGSVFSLTVSATHRFMYMKLFLKCTIRIISLLCWIISFGFFLFFVIALLKTIVQMSNAPEFLKNVQTLSIFALVSTLMCIQTEIFGLFKLWSNRVSKTSNAELV